MLLQGSACLLARPAPTSNSGTWSAHTRAPRPICLQPGTRDRIRGLLTRSGRYRTLEEEEDPEGGTRSLAAPAAGAVSAGGGIELARSTCQGMSDDAGSSQPLEIPHR